MHPLAKCAVLPSPPDSIAATQGPKADSRMTDPFGSATAVPRNANESKIFSGGYDANLHEKGPYLPQLTTVLYMDPRAA